MTQAILPIFKARPDGGRGDIVNIGSIAGREPYQGGSIYCASKAAVRSFTDALRRELIATRIRVIEVDPGQVETEFSVVRFGGDREKAKKVYEGVEPLTGEDIAEVVVFAVGRRENVVIADTLVFPNHQVSACGGLSGSVLMAVCRLLRRLCIGGRRRLTRVGWSGRYAQEDHPFSATIVASDKEGYNHNLKHPLPKSKSSFIPNTLPCSTPRTASCARISPLSPCFRLPEAYVGPVWPFFQYLSSSWPYWRSSRQSLLS